VGASFVDNDNLLSFTVNTGAYNNGDVWTFVSYPYNDDVELDDFSIVKTTSAKTSIAMGSAKLVNNRR
jgi:hypothetical protein